MNTDFSRTLALLRQEKGISQRHAAQELGISQALLSHYENGLREPGLAFVRKVCDYYHVSADYLLGRTLDRDGAVIDAQELYDASGEKGSLKGSVAATLQKKLLVNTVSLLFELLGRTGSRDAVNAAGRYLSGALYQLWRMLHRAAGGKDRFFALGGGDFAADAVDAEMRLARVDYARTLDALAREDDALPVVDGAVLADTHPGLMQSLTQVLHSTEEETKDLLEIKSFQEERKAQEERMQERLKAQEERVQKQKQTIARLAKECLELRSRDAHGLLQLLEHQYASEDYDRCRETAEQLKLVADILKMEGNTEYPSELARYEEIVTALAEKS